MHIVFIGGFASNKNQLAIIKRELESFFDKPVEVLSFREAITNPVKTKRLVRGAFVITHSVGILSIINATPKHVLAVAPPVPASRLMLFRNAIKKTLRLMRNARTMHRRRKIDVYHFHAFNDMFRNVPFYIKLLKNVSIFTTLPHCITLAQRDVTVTLAYMSKDHLFPRHSDGDLTPAILQGVQIKSFIEGEHDELLLNPIKVLQDIGITK